MNILEPLRPALTPEQFHELSQLAPREVHTAVAKGWLTEEQFLQAAARALNLKFVDLSETQPDPQLVQSFSGQDLFRFGLLPISTQDDCVVVATSDPFDLESVSELATTSGCLLETVLACRSQIDGHLKSLLGVGGGTVQELMSRNGEDGEVLDLGDADLDDESQASSVVKLVNELLLEAIQQRASDIHLEPDEAGLDVRYRVDGMLRLQPVPTEIHRFRKAIVSRLKIMAKLNIAEKRLPQDGRINLTVAGREVDVRVSIIPMLHGEGVVMRLLDKSRTDFNLDGLKFPGVIDRRWRELIKRPHGMILVTGPTGSGKTTTLYSSLVAIRNPNTKIITVEDPVEYQLKGISQIQVQSKIGLNFAAGLRSILRHDPDVILIGEIRDGETATSAVQAALTGHTVLSTLHTNDACGAYPRLIDMGIDPYLVSSTVEGVLAQRLLRRLCPDCKEPYMPADDDMPADFDAPAAAIVYRPVGCKSCHGVGYSGRVPIFELVQSDSVIRRFCANNATANEIRQHAMSRGMRSLRQSGWERVIEGVTTMDEVIRCCAVEDDDSAELTISGATSGATQAQTSGLVNGGTHAHV